jgi:hypothetical protein
MPFVPRVTVRIQQSMRFKPTERSKEFIPFQALLYEVSHSVSQTQLQDRSHIARPPQRICVAMRLHIRTLTVEMC